FAASGRRGNDAAQHRNPARREESIVTVPALQLHDEPVRQAAQPAQGQQNRDAGVDEKKQAEKGPPRQGPDSGAAGSRSGVKRRLLVVVLLLIAAGGGGGGWGGGDPPHPPPAPGGFPRHPPPSPRGPPVPPTT